MIVSYASADDIATCLATIERLAPDARVALREHHPERASYERLQAVAAASNLTVRAEHDPTNPGFGAGCNALASGSSASWFLFLNPDTELVSWPWAARRPNPPKVIGPMFTKDATDHFGTSYRIRDEIARSWLRRPGRMPEGAGFVSGAALLIDADSFRRVDGFDPAYFLFYEDIDLCLRANHAGTPTAVEPRWQVAHRRAHSTKGRFAESLVWSYESGCRFHGAHGSPVSGYRAYIVADALARAAVHAVRGDADRSRAYRALARRAVSDCVRRGRSRP